MLKSINFDTTANKNLEQHLDLLKMLQPLARFGSQISVSMINVPEDVKTGVQQEKEEIDGNAKIVSAELSDTRAKVEEFEKLRHLVGSNDTTRIWVNQILTKMTRVLVRL